MKETIREYVGFAVALVIMSAIATLIIVGAVVAVSFLTPVITTSERCTVTLPSGVTVTRYECRAGNRGSGVLYCDGVDYAPAAWVTVTCGE